MKLQRPKSAKLFVRLEVILVLVSIAVLAVVIGPFFSFDIFAPQTQGSRPSGVQTPDPQRDGSPRSTIHLPLISLSATDEQRVAWQTYSDSLSGIQFKYPTTWHITDIEPGRSVRLIEPSSEYYRAVELMIEQNQVRAASTDFANERLERIYPTEVLSMLRMEPFIAAEVQGIRVTGFPTGIHTMVTLAHNNTAFTITLIEGGEIGGATAYSFPTAQEDEELFFQILDTIEFPHH